MKSVLLALGLLALPAPLAAAQTRVWTVAEYAPADFDDLQPAIDAAADGDVILVNTGDYGRITIDAKSLVIVKDPAALFARVSRLNGFQPDQPVIVVRNLGADQSVCLRGIESAALHIEFPLNVPQELEVPSALFTNNQGPIYLEDYSLGPPLGVPDSALQVAVGLRAENCASVTLVDGFVRGLSDSGSAAISAVDSNVFVFDSIAFGAPGRLDLPGGDGIHLVDGSLYLAGSSVAGGRGVDAIALRDRTRGGNALALAGTAPVARWLDTALQGGAGGMHPMGVGSPAADGLEIALIAPVATTEALPGTGGGVTAPLVVSEGGDLALVLHGEPGDLVSLRASAGHAASRYRARFGGPVLTVEPAVRVRLGVLPETGSLPSTLAAPLLRPGEEGGTFLLQPFLVRDPGGITPGGSTRAPLVRLGTPTLLTILGSAP